MPLKVVYISNDRSASAMRDAIRERGIDAKIGTFKGAGAPDYLSRLGESVSSAIDKVIMDRDGLHASYDDRQLAAAVSAYAAQGVLGKAEFSVVSREGDMDETARKEIEGKGVRVVSDIADIDEAFEPMRGAAPDGTVRLGGAYAMEVPSEIRKDDFDPFANPDTVGQAIAKDTAADDGNPFADFDIVGDPFAVTEGDDGGTSFAGGVGGGYAGGEGAFGGYGGAGAVSAGVPAEWANAAPVGTPVAVHGAGAWDGSAQPYQQHPDAMPAGSGYGYAGGYGGGDVLGGGAGAGAAGGFGFCGSGDVVHLSPQEYQDVTGGFRGDLGKEDFERLMAIHEPEWDYSLAKEDLKNGKKFKKGALSQVSETALANSVYIKEQEDLNGSYIPNDKSQIIVSYSSKGGSGKSLSNCENVIIYNYEHKNISIKTVGDIQVGDYVFSRNGKPTKVLEVHPQGELEAYKVTLADGRSIICSGDHIWNVLQYVQSKPKNKVTKVTTAEMLEKGVIKKSKDGKHDARRWRIPMNEALVFPKRDLPVDPYLLGLLIADGGLGHGSVCLSTGDQETIDWCTQWCEEHGLHFRKNNADNDKDYGYRLSADRGEGNWLIAALKELDLWHTTAGKFIPDIYKFSSVEQRTALLQGLMDADGTARRGRTSITTISARLRNDCMWLIRSLGMTCSCTKDNRKEKYSTGACYTVHIHATDFPLFRLTRKIEELAAYRAKQAKQISFQARETPVEYENAVKDEHLPLEPYLYGVLCNKNIASHRHPVTDVYDDTALLNLAVAADKHMMSVERFRDKRPRLRLCSASGNEDDVNRFASCLKTSGLTINQCEPLNAPLISDAYRHASPAARKAVLQGIMDRCGCFSPKGIPYVKIPSERARSEFIDFVSTLGYRCVEGTTCHTRDFALIETDDLSIFTSSAKREELAGLLVARGIEPTFSDTQAPSDVLMGRARTSFAAIPMSSLSEHPYERDAAEITAGTVSERTGTDAETLNIADKDNASAETSANVSTSASAGDVPVPFATGAMSRSKMSNDARFVSIDSIEKLPYKVPMTCILVDNPEHTFVAGDFFVSHNTSVSVMLATQLNWYFNREVLLGRTQSITSRVLLLSLNEFDDLSTHDIGEANASIDETTGRNVLELKQIIEQTNGDPQWDDISHCFSVSHRNFIFYLPSMTLKDKFTTGISITANDYRKIIEVCTRFFNYIILDCPDMFAEQKEDLMTFAFNASDVLMMIVEADQRSTINLFQLLKGLEADANRVPLNPKKCLLVVNKYATGDNPYRGVTPKHDQIPFEKIAKSTRKYFSHAVALPLTEYRSYGNVVNGTDPAIKQAAAELADTVLEMIDENSDDPRGVRHMARR